MLRYTVDVIPQAKKNEVIKHSNTVLRVKLTVPAKEDRANKALVSLLSDYFGVSKSKILIMSGEKRRRKMVGVMHD